MFPTRPLLENQIHPNQQPTAPGFTLSVDSLLFKGHLVTYFEVQFPSSFESEYSVSSSLQHTHPSIQWRPEYIYIPKHVRPFWIITRAGWLLYCTLQPNDNSKMWATKTLSYRHSYRATSRLIIPNTPAESVDSPPGIILFCSSDWSRIECLSSCGGVLLLLSVVWSWENTIAREIYWRRDRDEEMGIRVWVVSWSVSFWTTELKVIVWYLQFYFANFINTIVTR